MKQIIYKALLLLVITSSQVIFGQIKTDSIRIVEEALKLIALPEPQFDSPFMPNPSPKDLADLGFEQPNTSETVVFNMKDHVKITAQKYPFLSNKTVILLHGVLASSYTYNKMSGLIREALQVEVISIDLRGHGASGGIPGDISKPNQYAEDLNEIITTIRSDKPHQKIILVGHSMGGGIILRHSETFPETKIDGYVLFAPNFGTSSATTNQQIDLKNSFIKSHLSRGLGLKMLNEFGIHQYDSLKVVFYNLPKQMPITSYSYRSMNAIYPENLRSTLKRIVAPFITLVGKEDEVFIAEEYPILIKSYSNGDCYLIKNETHNGIRHNEEAMNKIREWSIKNGL
ncbi:alpha/beta fold hydrolase [Lutibacter maritimus]|uniref:Lysophospholipase, alpha-beta hydrolase superfamily n=1 Tax=Lutibacter maritimus TaxID=593133 RepID=A0A1I6QFT7_9FLAO|nr:alpha/beta fold hydrolase [Lutibacter maritimus]SFS51326.1 Lysophospholipase, alpha-beta hydrolase superfamily [Lutibacter maritimus]